LKVDFSQTLEQALVIREQLILLEYLVLQLSAKILFS